MKRIVQGFSLFLFSVCFVFAAYGLPAWFPADIYLRLDPLLGLNAIISAREIIGRALWSLVVLGATLLIGRFFCAYVCPLGGSIDLLDRLFFLKKARPILKGEATLRKIKYAALIVSIAGAITGLSLAYFLDPISLLTRTYTFVLYPLATTGINLFLDALRPVFQALGWVTLSHLHLFQSLFYMSVTTCLLFGVIIALSRLAPRFWCRYLCPLGALLSLVSPLALFKRKVNRSCNECGKCGKACPMGAIPEDPKMTRLSECIQCRTCAKACPRESVSFPASFSIGGEHSTVDVSRRMFSYSAVGGLAFGFLSSKTPFTSLQGKHPLIRPPGAIPETQFLRTCIRCGECMKSCLTNTLQPSLWESGLAGLWTPRMEPRLAPCEQDCNVCGKVCPTQAIRSLDLEEKRNARVGTAILRKEECLVWSQNKVCLICDEICPYNAIVFRTEDGHRRPVVIAAKCNGCGYCQQRCPVRGESAIVVVPDGEIRLTKGSYVTEANKLQLEFKADPGDDAFSSEDSGSALPVREEAVQTEKPKGFL